MVEVYKKLLQMVSGHGTIISIVFFLCITLLGTSVALAAIVWLPADHFQDPGVGVRSRRHPILRTLLTVFRNLIGFLVVIPLGILMSFPLVPGPGLIFTLLGVSMVDFPGKRALMRRLLRRKSVHRFISNTRARFGRAPFDLDTE